MQDHVCAEDEVFVFGSNLAGAHGRGAAKTAMQDYGAVYGVGEGLRGRSYAIPTKDARIQTLELGRIKYYVSRFIDFASKTPDIKYFVTAIGCGLAGYDLYSIAPMFINAPANCRLPPDWVSLNDKILAAKIVHFISNAPSANIDVRKHPLYDIDITYINVDLHCSSNMKISPARKNDDVVRELYGHNKIVMLGDYHSSNYFAPPFTLLPESAKHVSSIQRGSDIRSSYPICHYYPNFLSKFHNRKLVDISGLADPYDWKCQPISNTFGYAYSIDHDVTYDKFVLFVANGTIIYSKLLNSRIPTGSIIHKPLPDAAKQLSDINWPTDFGGICLFGVNNSGDLRLLKALPPFFAGEFTCFKHEKSLAWAVLAWDNYDGHVWDWFVNEKSIGSAW